ncbi:MAG: glycosyltransferase [Fibromonadaceae bacterium]|jgi:glycosyltransferase involved in cell wall biosynthesis|nr:glycosyltransferase [Fibromonadaceae bacterium]
MEVNPLISVIVPVYNTEAYLNRCIESIANQAFKKIEIILVNDGSTDTSGVICDLYAKKDSRIHVIHKKNEGVTVARKTGVEHASGEWICFVDSDDEVPENSVQVLLAHIRDDVDIVKGMYKYIGKGRRPYKPYYLEQNNMQYMKFLLKGKISQTPHALVRKTLFDNFTFDIPAHITNGEDLIMNLRIGQKARRIILLPNIVYHYIWRAGSAISNKPMLNKNYRIAYYRALDQSIHQEYRKALRAAIIYKKLFIKWRLLKNIIKKMLFGNRR